MCLMRVILSLTAALAALACPGVLDWTYADMHDGDKKEATVKGRALTITPSGNNQTWKVDADLNPTTCAASVNFRVQGKPNPPPVNLLATFWRAVAAGPNAGSPAASKSAWEFTDPSGKLAAKDYPLNQWLQLEPAAGSSAVVTCPGQIQAVYADQHDGDRKEVAISGKHMTIRPSGNNQTWEVHALLDTSRCAASVDFNVPGKPSPPPVNVTLTLWKLSSESVEKTSFEFTDPSGTLAPAHVPLNSWIEVERPGQVLMA